MQSIQQRLVLSSFHAPPFGRFVIEVMLAVTALAKTSVANARCAVTKIGSVPVRTVIIPSTTWPSNSKNVNELNAVTMFGHRYFFQAKSIVATTKSVTTIVHTLCVNSIRMLGVKAGMT